MGHNTGFPRKAARLILKTGMAAVENEFKAWRLFFSLYVVSACLVPIEDVTLAVDTCASHDSVLLLRSALGNRFECWQSGVSETGFRDASM